MQQTFKILALALLCMGGVRTAEAQWEKIGWEGGGQVTPMAQLGNTLYGIANYSVYKSTDWGATWTMFNKGFPNNTLLYPGFQYFKDYLIVMHDYESGGLPRGFYYCKEKDKQWTFKSLSPIPNDVYNTRIAFWSGDSIFAFHGTLFEGDGYFFSHDGGNSWEGRMNGIVANVNDNVVDPYFLGNSFFTSKYGQVYNTKNFGLTWDSLTIQTNSHILRADNSGYPKTFSLLDSILLKPFTSNGSTLYGGLFRTIDTGRIWSITTSIKDYPYNFPINNVKILGHKTIMTTGLYPPCLLFVSDDLGTKWQRVVTIDTNLVIGDIFGKDNFYIMSTRDGYILGNPKDILLTDSTFKTFTRFVSSEKGVMANSRTLVGVAGTTLFALPDSNRQKYYDSLLLSTDNGNTWNEQLFFERNKLDIHRWIMDGKNIYASGIHEDSLPCLFRTTDDGITWNIVNTFTKKDTIKQYFVQHDTMVLRRQKDYLISIDRGKSWVVQTYPAISDSVITMVYRNGMFMMLKKNIEGIYISTDFGTNWEIENPGNRNAYHGQYIFGDRLFILSNGYPRDFFFKTKENNQWQMRIGVENLSLDLNSDDGSNIYAVLNESGHKVIYISLDSGSNWQQLGEPVTNSTDVFVGSDYIFLAGPTELWRAPKSILPAAKVSQPENISSISITDCYPNPAKDEVRIAFSIKKHGDVLLRAFDMTGKIIATIMSEAHDAGSFETVWNTKALPSGSYIIELTSGGEKVSREIEIVK